MPAPDRMNPTIQDPSGRGAHRLEWARGALGDPYAQLERASMDAGFRSYWRSLGDGPGRIVMDSPPALEDVRPWLSMRELLVGGDALEAARALKPIDERALPFGKTVLLFDGAPRSQLSALGETRNPGLADLFVAIMKGIYA